MAVPPPAVRREAAPLCRGPLAGPGPRAAARRPGRGSPPGNPRPFLPGFRETDGDRLLAALHLAAATFRTAAECAALATAHRTLDCLRRALAVPAPASAPRGTSG